MRERRHAYTEHIRITLTGKITATYLLLVFFGLIASGYALNSLHKQTTVSRKLVNIDIRAADLARDLQSELRTQERLAGQLTIRPNTEAFDLLKEKLNNNESNQTSFLAIIPAEQQQHTPAPGHALIQSPAKQRRGLYPRWRIWNQTAGLVFKTGIKQQGSRGVTSWLGRERELQLHPGQRGPPLQGRF